MPFVHLQDEEDWPEDAPDDYEPPDPGVEDYHYLPPPEFGGAPEPVRFSTSGNPKSARLQHQGAKRPLGLRFLMWLLARILPGSKEMLAGMKQQEQHMAERRAKLFATFVPALRSVGGRRLRCVYDGGNDEGFAWFDHLETTTGQMNLTETVAAIEALQLEKSLREADLMSEQAELQSELEELLNYSLPEEFACLLLGFGFGTGAYTMYGAFTVDLDECTITDDEHATVPANGNIAIGGE